MITATLNVELLRKLSPGWAETLLKPLGYEQRRDLRLNADKCILGCFWGYGSQYYWFVNSKYCKTCSDLADAVSDVIYALEDRKLIAEKGNFDKTTSTLDLDEIAIKELNEISEKLYVHALEKHPERIKQQ